MGIWASGSIKNDKELSNMLWWQRELGDYIERGGTKAYDERTNAQLLKSVTNIKARVDRLIDEYKQH